MKIFKILAVFSAILVLLTGCDDDKPPVVEANESVPFDVPISQIDANVSIDEKLPPEPAIEGEEKPKNEGVQIETAPTGGGQ